MELRARLEHALTCDDCYISDSETFSTVEYCWRVAGAFHGPANPKPTSMSALDKMVAEVFGPQLVDQLQAAAKFSRILRKDEK